MSGADPMAEIRASFFLECEDLLEALQDGLSALDGGDEDPEIINVCFRAVHSIKGGAGAFGLEDLVRFAHRYETVMDEVRSGRLTPDRDAMALFFRAADLLSDVVRASRDASPMDDAAIEDVLTSLETLVGGDVTAAAEEEEEVSDFQPMTLSLDLPGVASGPTVYQIEFKPKPELFASGNEPLHLLRALENLGELEVETKTTDLPPLDSMDAEATYISFALKLTSESSTADIEEVFEFVDGLCELNIEIVEQPQSDPDAPLISLELPEPAPEATADETPAPAVQETADAPPPPEAASPPKKNAKPSAPSGGGEGGRSASAPKATVRVDLDRIERLVNLVGELVINQAMLSQSVVEANLDHSAAVSSGLEEFMQLTRDIQDSVMMIRAQPVKSLFQRMSRIVREASSAIGKSVRLETIGEGTEVDKTVIERLADPLTHMIRNAVDHGLESSEERIAAGKPADGIITMSAAHRSGRVIIEVGDDGGGINRERVQKIAEEKGLIAPGLALSDSEVDQLLFLPGFSTAKEVSDLSGRGVGMDVVRSAIQALGGRIAITSESGVGTTFSISLPLTLAVLDGMVVEAASETLVVPLGSIVETLSLEADRIETVGKNQALARIRGEFVPLVDLGAALGFREQLDTLAGAVALLIAKDDGSRVALVVDQIVEQRQVVIKGLEESYGRVPGVAAATILGNGRIALILDPVDLTANAGTSAPASSETLSLAG